MDQGAVERLFDPRRDPNERVREDDWFPDAGHAWRALYACDTVGARRRWYTELLELGPALMAVLWEIGYQMAYESFLQIPPEAIV